MARQTLPSLLDPMVDKMGRIIRPWNIFFQNLINPPAAFQSITVGASPYAFTASSDGFLSITGGTISAVVITRGTSSVTVTGNGIIPLAAGDVVTVTYTVLPTLNFIPD